MGTKPKTTTVQVTKTNRDFITSLQTLPEYSHLTSFNAILTHLLILKHKTAYTAFLKGLNV